jgi:tetratricopeptide (TPR) repeat protein
MNTGLTIRRALIPALVVLATGVAAIGGPMPAFGQAGQSVRAAASPGGGRIVFAWTKPVQAHAAAVGNRVVLIFGRSLKASLAGVARSIPKVVRRVDVSTDRRALTIVLRRPHRMRLIRRGRLVVIDLRRPGAAAKAPAAKARKAKAPAAKAGKAKAPAAKPRPAKAPAVKPRPTKMRVAKAGTAKAAPKPMVKSRKPVKPMSAAAAVGVSYRWTPTLQRLTFAWKAAVAYSVERIGGIIWLKFRRAGRIDTAALNRSLRGADIGVQARTDKAALEVFVRAPQGRPMRHYRAGKNVVIEVLGRTPRPRPMAKRPAKATGAIKPGLKSARRGKTPKKMAPGAGDGGAVKPVDPRAKPPLPQISLSASAGTSTLRFDWPRTVPAAAFRRGRYIWLVFGAPGAFDLTAIRAALKDRVFSLKQVRMPHTTALRIAASPETGIAIARDGWLWLVTIKTNPGKARRRIAIETQPGAAGGGRVLLKVAEAGRPVELTDPGVGDIITVVPVTTPGLGVAAARRFAKFRLLATVQGMVVEGAADGVAMRAGPAAVSVTGYGGLFLSGPRRRQAPKKMVRKNSARIFDFDKWRDGPASDFPREFAKRKSKRQHAVAMASKAERNARRLELARFYFAHGYASDTLGVLRRIEMTDAVLARTAKFRALRGASRFLMGQLKNAGRDLYHSSLDGSPEISLWRGAVAARVGKWKSANREFLRSGPVIRHYPARLRTRLGHLAAQAAIAAGDLQRAKGLVALARMYRPPLRDAEKLDHLQAAILAKSGRRNQAIAIWRRLSDSAVSQGTRIRATAARIEHQLLFGTLEAKEAIEELEKARYIWRGDRTEYLINELLGRVYIKDGRVVKGLEALDRAGRIDADLAKARGLRSRMQRQFVRLFLGPRSAKMPPLRALGVFHEFAHLMPAGPGGDKMITALADRLVAVDLLGRAASLLEEQIKKRLSGAERAKVGARLALLRLLDKKPAAAIEALRKSDVENMPAELAGQRRRLRARALASLGQSGNALVLLGPDRGREAELLRADIHWKANAWKKAAAAYGRIAAGIPKGAAALDEAQSRVVLAWAVTLALAGDGKGLKTLRARFGKAMASGPYRATFQVIANEIEAGVPDYRKIAAKVSEVDAYQAFMTTYRRRIAAGGLKAVN